LLRDGLQVQQDCGLVASRHSLLLLSGMLPVEDHKQNYLDRLGKELDTQAGCDADGTAMPSTPVAAAFH
jgi:hypothetical protein